MELGKLLTVMVVYNPRLDARKPLPILRSLGFAHTTRIYVTLKQEGCHIKKTQTPDFLVMEVIYN